jgi:hypothetical protein
MRQVIPRLDSFQCRKHQEKDIHMGIYSGPSYNKKQRQSNASPFKAIEQGRRDEMSQSVLIFFPLVSVVAHQNGAF